MLNPPLIAAFNHIEHTDIPAVVACVPHTLVSLSAKKMRDKPVGQLFKLGANIWIEQDAPDRQALKEALRVLEAGGAIGIFPEGHRSRSPGMKEARSGATYIAQRAGVPIVPIGLVGTDRLLRQPRPRVRAIIGQPFTLPTGRARTPDLARYTDIMMCAIASLLPVEYQGFYAGHPLIEEIRQHGTQSLIQQHASDAGHSRPSTDPTTTAQTQD